MTYRVFNGTAPQYLAELRQVCSNDRLWSSSCHDYVVWSFSVAGPTAWNSSRQNIVLTYILLFLQTVLKRFYCLSFIHSYSEICLLYFLLDYSIVSEAPWTLDGGTIANYQLLEWLIIMQHLHLKRPSGDSPSGDQDLSEAVQLFWSDDLLMPHRFQQECNFTHGCPLVIKNMYIQVDFTITITMWYLYSTSYNIGQWRWTRKKLIELNKQNVK